MIRYALLCAKGHTFESWFASSAAYDSQVARGLLECPACGDRQVEKALMRPNLAGARKGGPSDSVAASEAAAPIPPPSDPAPMVLPSPVEQTFRAKLKEFREHLKKHADYVGQHFADEARKMHYGEIEHRSIYGEATPEQAKELVEEGIDVHPLPVLPEDRN